ncbi:hypothetical protein [Amycolatopsis sp.]|uniref:hypothetical protein n=1 Tax=Amycolatopsis sp. TaxID=37632 RepID=UPI002D7EAE1E|nr:hypothetical protein [Amycolatopsis sp.]HET6709937.1 hypothetical protein [Amycolatopsis sp.]
MPEDIVTGLALLMDAVVSTITRELELRRAGFAAEHGDSFSRLGNRSEVHSMPLAVEDRLDRQRIDVDDGGDHHDARAWRESSQDSIVTGLANARPSSALAVSWYLFSTSLSVPYVVQWLC